MGPKSACSVSFPGSEPEWKKKNPKSKSKLWAEKGPRQISYYSSKTSPSLEDLQAKYKLPHQDVTHIQTAVTANKDLL